jgi:hypothetical protein
MGENILYSAPCFGKYKKGSIRCYECPLQHECQVKKRVRADG